MHAGTQAETKDVPSFTSHSRRVSVVTAEDDTEGRRGGRGEEDKAQTEEEETRGRGA